MKAFKVHYFNFSAAQIVSENFVIQYLKKEKSHTLVPMHVHKVHSSGLTIGALFTAFETIIIQLQVYT